MSPTSVLAGSIEFNLEKHQASVVRKDPSLELIGIGRSAAVFRIASTDRALKVFFPEFAHLAYVEAEIYQQLQGSPYYPALHEFGDNYIEIDYIAGQTLFDCLRLGIRLTADMLRETDQALAEASGAGLTPSDVHLKNILLTPEGEIRLIDVARFRQANGLRQWKDLKKAFFLFYQRPYFPKQFPKFLLNWIAALYNKWLKVRRLSPRTSRMKKRHGDT